MTTAEAPTYLHYKLTLRSPAIISMLSDNPGSAVTQPFIPGSAIRGAVAARLLAESGSGDSDELPKLVLSGAIRYLHAYLELGGTRALPVPASWRSDKHGTKGHDVDGYDLAAYSGQVGEEYDDDDLQDAWPVGSLASVGKLFASATSMSGARRVATPRIDARLHQQRDRVKGRSWKDKDETAYGALFACEYLEPAQVFHGVIQVMPAASGQITRIKTLLARVILLGRSRRAGYGGEAEIAFIHDGQHEYDHLSGRLSKDIKPGERFRMMLVSAYVGRHPETGQMDPAALEHELRARLGDVTVERRRWSFETLGGFNRKWRLEVPQALAVAAGAVLVLEAGQHISRNALRQLEHEGLGERRVEGLGRVVFLVHSDDDRRLRLSPERSEPVDQKPSNLRPRVSKHERKQIDFVERRIVLTAMRAELARVAADLARNTRNIPAGNLLGGIRTLFRGVHDEGTAASALDKLASWCASASDKLDGCHLGEESLGQWMKKLAIPESDKSGWDAIVVASHSASTITGLAAKHYVTTKSAAEGIVNDSTAQLTVHLIDTLLATLARKNQRGLS